MWNQLGSIRNLLKLCIKGQENKVARKFRLMKGISKKIRDEAKQHAQTCLYCHWKQSER